MATGRPRLRTRQRVLTEKEWPHTPVIRRKPDSGMTASSYFV